MQAGRMTVSFLTGSKLRMSVPQNIVRSMCSTEVPKFETLNVTRPKEMIVQVELNRPNKRNAMNRTFWKEMIECFNFLATDSNCRSIVLTGAGKSFTAGLDLADFATTDAFQQDLDVGRKAFAISKSLTSMQESFNVIEKCPKPVIAAIQDACIGGGIDMTSACDIRYCTSDAYFQIKEVDIGLAADLGTLQRFPKIVGNDSLVRELVYTARKMNAEEALKLGFVSKVFPDKQSMVEGALEMAGLIASKSPIAVQGSKVSMVYSRDSSVKEGLDHVRVWNAGMLQSEDVMKAAMASMQKEEPVFSKL